MKVFVGLGNPGFKYRKTRHNIGFFVIDELAKQWNVSFKKRKFNAAVGMTTIAQGKAALVKPYTYMNNSGEAIRPLLDYYNATTDDLLVVYDDMDLPTGNIRLREKGGHGGHNGVRSLIQHTGTKAFKRIRIGIGHPASGEDVIDYVLKPFPKHEKQASSDAVKRAAEACEAWMRMPFPEVMNEYNR